MNDPNKFVNVPESSSMRGGYSHSGPRDRGGYRRRYDHHYDREKDERKKREYVDYDDPTRN